MDRMKRSVAKAVVWRALGIVLLGGLAYLLTGDWGESGALTILFNVIRTPLYIVHERVWARSTWGTTNDTCVRPAERLRRKR